MSNRMGTIRQPIQPAGAAHIVSVWYGYGFMEQAIRTAASLHVARCSIQSPSICRRGGRKIEKV